MLVIDTGSGNLAVDSSICEGCFGSSRYDFEHSATASPLHCTGAGTCPCTSSCECDVSRDACLFSISYVDGSGWTALAINDTVALTGNALPKWCKRAEAVFSMTMTGLWCVWSLFLKKIMIIIIKIVRAHCQLQ
eukprot:TRINITY_DN11974_c0_g1_i4.p1 TRINITY_DN11974_c0_g1~~TRINITY_DN11974_c0_g1_i4.p1  ORF type:complete len:134 (+),score=5.79 TRINITY_DN11974_c0_g1_i4:255-656(+)